MTDFDKNAKDYLAAINKKLVERVKSPNLDDIVELSLMKIPNTNQHIYLNKALDASYLDPMTATAEDYKKYPLLRTDAVITADGCKTELVRCPADGEICVIDWLTMTMKADVFTDSEANRQPHERMRQNVLVQNVGNVLADLFGFGIDKENKSGRNFYERSWQLEHDAGFVCIGGQNDTVMICINGTGCTYGKQGWESHLHAWLELYSKGGKITRIDLCHDDFYGEYTSVDWFDKQHTIGAFNNGGRQPSVEHRGNWKNPNGKGRSLYIGSRSYSKYCRIYEKGKQLGDPDSLWVRTEVELKNRHFDIDNDVLLNPSSAFIACYPCFAIFNGKQNNDLMQRKEQQNSITFQRAFDILKNQYGRYLNFFRDVYQDDERLMNELTDIENKAYPERIDPLTIPDMKHVNIS